MQSFGVRSLRWLTLLAMLMLVLAACGDAEDEAEPEPDDDPGVGEPDEGDDPDEPDDDVEDTAEPDDVETAENGTLLFGDEQEPTILNALLLDGNTLGTAKVFNAVFLGAYQTTPDFAYEPVLLDGEAEIGEDPFTVTYTIRDEAVWSDGTDLTADDFAFTYETIMAGEQAEDDAFEGEFNITERIGYELVEDYTIEDDKTITFTFEEPYAPWQELFMNVLPEHVLEGEDFDEVWNTELTDPSTGEPIASGPFVFDEWDQGQQLRLIRNEQYWDGEVELEEIVIRYVPDTTTLTQQLRGAEIDMFDPQPQIEILEQLAEIGDRITYEVREGPFWEHVDFNTLVEPLDQQYVRQAIAQAINRDVLAETLISPVNPEVEPLENPIYMRNQQQYEPYFDRYDGGPQAAIALLEDNGCEQDGDGVFECEGERLSFRLGTTGGNERRELAQQLIQSDLADIGIEIEIDNDEGAAFFERLQPPENCEGGVCDWDIAIFGWIGSPDPVGNANIFGCDRPQNWTGWCNEDVTELMDEANSEIDEDARAQMWNEAASVITDEVPLVPLFQQPQLLAYDNAIVGPELNPTDQTNFWNVDEWARVE